MSLSIYEMHAYSLSHCVFLNWKFVLMSCDICEVVSDVDHFLAGMHFGTKPNTVQSRLPNIWLQTKWHLMVLPKNWQVLWAANQTATTYQYFGHAFHLFMPIIWYGWMGLNPNRPYMHILSEWVLWIGKSKYVFVFTDGRWRLYVWLLFACRTTISTGL